jgi:hypothetical protein
MANFSIDYDNLHKTVNNKIYRLDEVKHRLEKVAFDIVRFKDAKDDEELWQIQSADDGEYIVARYSTDDKKEEKTASVDKTWDVLVSQAGYMHIYYCGTPIAKFAASDLGLSTEDLKTVKRFLPSKLGSDKNFVKALLSKLNGDELESVQASYPEILQ